MVRVDYKDMVKFADDLIDKYRIFEGIELERLQTYVGMDTGSAWDFKTPMATGYYRPYTIKGSNRVEKITIGELHYMKRAKYCILNLTASDDYDLPVFACEFDETAARVGVTIDVMPLVDIVVYPEYREKYLDPVADLWRQYRTIPGLTTEGRCLVQRRYGPWPWARATQSPYTLDGHIVQPEDRGSIVEACAAYARIWLDCLKKAEPLKDSPYKQEMLARKRTLQKYYRDLDPGGEVIKKIFGEEKHKLFVSLVF
jgi:hypothetical protein